MAQRRFSLVNGFRALLKCTYLRPGVTTTTLLEDVTATINTDDNKVNGAMVFNDTTNKMVVAIGADDNSVWVDMTGSTAHTPV